MAMVSYTQYLEEGAINGNAVCSHFRAGPEPAIQQPIAMCSGVGAGGLQPPPPSLR